MGECNLRAGLLKPFLFGVISIRLPEPMRGLDLAFFMESAACLALIFRIACSCWLFIVFYLECIPAGLKLPIFLILIFVGWRPKLFYREAWPRSSTTLNFFWIWVEMTLAGTFNIVCVAYASGTWLGLISLPTPPLRRPPLSWRRLAFLELVSFLAERVG